MPKARTLQSARGCWLLPVAARFRFGARVVTDARALAQRVAPTQPPVVVPPASVPVAAAEPVARDAQRFARPSVRRVRPLTLRRRRLAAPAARGTGRLSAFAASCEPGADTCREPGASDGGGGRRRVQLRPRLLLRAHAGRRSAYLREAAKPRIRPLRDRLPFASRARIRAAEAARRGMPWRLLCFDSLNRRAPPARDVSGRPRAGRELGPAASEKGSSQMPKMKTKSGAKKRFKMTGTGKVRAAAQGKRHGMIKRTREVHSRGARHHGAQRLLTPRSSRSTCPTPAERSFQSWRQHSTTSSNGAVPWHASSAALPPMPSTRKF